MRIKSSL